MSTVISVENLGKKYNLNHQSVRQPYVALRDVLSCGIKSLGSCLRRLSNVTSGKVIQEEFWALKDISFEVRQGDRIGIIGRNGAGKSTLLKIFSRITEPTTGSARIKGRVASLLEVGTGFHPELTGRENIYLNGAILGMARSEIKRKFDEIVDFSEVEKFLDTPVKRYSSGMYVRLAFAVAAHLEPEILIIDEVLAVGDAQFQKKCLGRMGDVSKEGKTILFVSHNMTALQSLCNRAILLDAGRVADEGETERVVACYLQNGAPLQPVQIWSDPQTAPGNNIVRLHSSRVFCDGEEHNGIILVTTPLRMEFQFWNFESGAALNLSVVLYDQQDTCIFNSASEAKQFPNGLVMGVCLIPGNLLNDAVYRVRLLIVKDTTTALIDLENVASFEVHDSERSGSWYGKWVGAVRPDLRWETMCLES